MCPTFLVKIAEPGREPRRTRWKYSGPISYEARRFDEGKKIGVWDGVKAMYYIVKFNLFRRS